MSSRTAKPNRPDLNRSKDSGKVTPDAVWTKIHRSLISASVLDKAGMVYEVFPDFVAVLGKLSRPEIAELARQTDEVRRRRKGYKTPVDGHRIKAGGSGGMMDRTSNASDILQHPSTGEPRSGARHSSVKKEHEQNYRPPVNNAKEGRNYSQSQKNKKDDHEKRNASNISRPLAQPAMTTSEGKYADKTDEKLPIRPILKKEGTNRVRFDPGAQTRALPREISTEQGKRNAHVGRGNYNKQKDDGYRQYEWERAFTKEDSYRERVDSRHESVAYGSSRERNRDRDGVRPSTERRLTSFRNYHVFGRTDGKYTSPKHEIEVFVTGRTTDYRIQIVVEYEDLSKHVRR